MKKIISLLLYLFAGILFAEQIDVALSQGTEQSIVNRLDPKSGSPEVDANVTIKVAFNEALNPMFVKRSVSLKRLTDERIKGFLGFGFAKRKRQQSIQGNTAYDASTHMITFTPDKPLPVGFYEVSFRHLMTQKPGMHMRISPIVYRFYVPEVINGFKLPPEPEEEKNNETLLGIDFNDNGIRDDAEIYIIKRYAEDPKYPKTKTAIALQYAWASQKVLENPTIESKKHIDDALDCESYWAWKEMQKNTDGLSNFERGLYYSNLASLTDSELKDHIY
ncbi:MAG: Ig-like domain-containing protein [Sulfurimonas sp.]